jgi:hypothetical protein
MAIPGAGEMTSACYCCCHLKSVVYSAVTNHLHEHSPHHLAGCSVHTLTYAVANAVAAKQQTT